MDTTSKILFIATQDPDFLPIVSVMCDLMTYRVDVNTVSSAKEIENSFPELWEENQWLRMVAGTNVENIDRSWIDYLREEMRNEFSENKEKSSSENMDIKNSMIEETKFEKIII